MNTETTNQSKSKICPSCKKSFECKVASIQNCECATITLTATQRNYIAENFTDCLCVNCLKKIATDSH
ncbi:MAG: cysteine-rich CWC family protein [Leptospiraceae bacterium]|nr:cysteine-rich CWC family protein [Leptospiraceae bacterium]